MIKNGNTSAQVRSFSFGSFETTVEKTPVTYQPFEIPELTGQSVTRVNVTPKVIRAEREAESKAQFRVDEIVRDLRGLTGQEKNDLETRIKTEVEKRLKETRESAYREGLDKGRLEGSDAAMKEALLVHQNQIEEMAAMLQKLQAQCEARLNANKHDIYEMSKRLIKWLVHKEVNDSSYLPKLLEKLVLEMNQRQNILIRVHPDDFAAMPQVLEAVQARVGQLTNVRVEPDLEMQGRGIILETENGIIDSTPEAMFQTIDKLYETVVNHGGE